MPANTTPIFPGTIRSSLSQITNSDGTNLKTIFTAGSNGSRVDAIWIYSTSENSKTVNLYQSDGTTDYLIATYTIEANSGAEILANAMLGVLNNCDALYLQNGQSLKMNVTSALSAGEVINIVVNGGDY